MEIFSLRLGVFTLNVYSVIAFGDINFHIYGLPRPYDG